MFFCLKRSRLTMSSGVDAPSRGKDSPCGIEISYAGVMAPPCSDCSLLAALIMLRLLIASMLFEISILCSDAFLRVPPKRLALDPDCDFSVAAFKPMGLQPGSRTRRLLASLGLRPLSEDLPSNFSESTSIGYSAASLKRDGRICGKFPVCWCPATLTSTGLTVVALPAIQGCCAL